MSRDYRDLTIEMLADDEAAIVDVAADYQRAYRAAVSLLAEQHRQIVARDRTVAALRDELRRYTRLQVTRAEAA